MSKRARSLRKLASLLTGASGRSVRIYYDSGVRRHRVVWTNGPDVAQMYTIAMRHAATVPALDLTTLLWDRGSTTARAQERAS